MNNFSGMKLISREQDVGIGSQHIPIRTPLAIEIRIHEGLFIEKGACMVRNQRPNILKVLAK
jgi:hypothetical protein